MKSEFTRSRETLRVTLPNGHKTKIAWQLKNGIGQVFWYYIQLQCKGWLEFDLRAATTIAADDKRIWECSCDPKQRLAFVAELLQNESSIAFRNDIRWTNEWWRTPIERPLYQPEETAKVIPLKEAIRNLDQECTDLPF